MFTQRAGLLGFVAFCFYLIAVVNSLPGFYYLLSWMSLGLLAASLGIAFLSLIGLDCQWRLGQSRGYAAWNPEQADDGETGEIPTLLLALRNTGTLNKTGILLEVHFKSTGGNQDSPQWTGWRKRKKRDAPQVTAHRYLLEAIPSGTGLEVSLPLYHLPRGRHEVVQLVLIGSDVLGLFRVRRRLSLETEGPHEILVGPPLLLEASRGQTLGRGRLATGAHRVQRFGVGDEVRGTRAYVPGDDLRHVHWKSTARAGELVVREWEHTGHSAVLVVWDGAPGTTWGQGRFDTTEIGLSLVASLCATLARADVPCALACLGKEAVYLEPESRTGVQSLSNSQFLALASASAERNGDAIGSLEASSRGRNRDYEVVFWVTASLSPALPDAVRRLGSRVQPRIALVDGARIRSWTSEGRSSKNVFEAVEGLAYGDGTASHPRGTAPGVVPVTAQAYDTQEHVLRELGAHVIRVAPNSPGDVPNALRSAISYLIESV